MAQKFLYRLVYFSILKSDKVIPLLDPEKVDYLLGF
jgi:hypothetical protein